MGTFVGSEGQVPTDPGKPARKRLRRVVSVGLFVVVFLAAVAGGLIAWKQNSTADQWRTRDRQEVATNHRLLSSLSSANASIDSLNSMVTRLNGHVDRLQSQVSAVADAKEKALDQNALLSQLNAQSATVSQQLETCVDDMNSLLTEFSNDVSSDEYDPALESTADTAAQECSTAQADNQQLQTILGSAG